jgi:hypothetical protein
MGIIFGMTGSKEPPFRLLMTNAASGLSYEVRMYQPYFVAEFRDEFDSESKRNSESFSALAKYIGVFGKPENEQGNAMAMTSPVIQNSPASGTAIAMTSPVVSGTAGGDYFQFVLPFEYTKIESIPRPLNNKIRIKAIPRRVLAVTTFSGSHNKNVCSEKFDKLYEAIKGKLIDPAATPQWSIAQYHPPFTLPFMRRNEVWVELSEKFPEVKRLIEEAEQVPE